MLSANLAYPLTEYKTVTSLLRTCFSLENFQTFLDSFVHCFDPHHTLVAQSKVCIFSTSPIPVLVVEVAHVVLSVVVEVVVSLTVVGDVVVVTPVAVVVSTNFVITTAAVESTVVDKPVVVSTLDTSVAAAACC